LTFTKCKEKNIFKSGAALQVFLEFASEITIQKVAIFLPFLKFRNENIKRISK